MRQLAGVPYAGEEKMGEAIAARIFHGQMQLMKDMLERGEMIFGGDRENPGYKRFKQETMRVHYTAIDEFWTLVQGSGLVEKCECGAMARNWTDCPQCGGSGFTMKETHGPDGCAG